MLSGGRSWPAWRRVRSPSSLNAICAQSIIQVLNGKKPDQEKSPLILKQLTIKNLAWSIASNVLDPEIPCVTIGELGIIRDLNLHNNKATVFVSPTYSGCPAVLAIELAIQNALLEAGFETKIKRVLSPPWTTDWISEDWKKKT